MNEIDPEKVDYWVRKRGLKRYLFTEKLGEHKTNYSQWLSGKRKINLRHYDLIAKLLKVPLEQLMRQKEMDRPLLPLVDAVDLLEFSPVTENLDSFLMRKQQALVNFPMYDNGNVVVRVDSSMDSDEFPVGSLLLLNTREPPAPNGAKVIVRLSGGPVIGAHFFFDRVKGCITLDDFRRDIPSKSFSAKENFAFWIWVVVASLRNERIEPAYRNVLPPRLHVAEDPAPYGKD